MVGILIVMVMAFATKGQRMLIPGQVFDDKGEPVVGAHVRNVSSDNITVTNARGAFQLPLKPGDTLLTTSVGFEPNIHVFGSGPKGLLIITMQPATTSLDELTVYSIPPLDRFKEMILETEVPEDTLGFWYYGVAKPVFKGDVMVQGKVHKKFLYALSQPTSFIYYNVSRTEKEKRKYYQIQQSQGTKLEAEEKFTREWVTEQTGLTGDKLTDFIAFCAFSDDYLATFPLYVIREDMLIKFEEFKKKSEE